MKKIISVILAVILSAGIFASCGKENRITVEKPPIEYESILKINRRQALAKKYGSVTEYVYNMNTKSGEDVVWSIKCDYSDEKYNTIIDMGENYKCYYYNGDIMAEYQNRFSYIVNFRNKYEETLSEALKRDIILSYNFYQVDSYIETESGYFIEYSCKAGPDIADELEDWNVKVNDKIYVSFDLDDKMEIQSYSYYIDISGKKTEIVKVVFKFGEKVEFPEEITNQEREKHTVTIYENAGTSNTYKEIYENVPDGFTIDVNSNLYVYDAYKDVTKREIWNFASDKVTEDTHLYLDNESSGLSYKEYEFMEGNNDE